MQRQSPSPRWCQSPAVARMEVKTYPKTGSVNLVRVPSSCSSILRPAFGSCGSCVAAASTACSGLGGKDCARSGVVSEGDMVRERGGKQRSGGHAGVARHILMLIRADAVSCRAGQAEAAREAWSTSPSVASPLPCLPRALKHAIVPIHLASPVAAAPVRARRCPASPGGAQPVVHGAQRPARSRRTLSGHRRHFPPPAAPTPSECANSSRTSMAEEMPDVLGERSDRVRSRTR